MDRYKGYFFVVGTEQNLTKTLLGGLYQKVSEWTVLLTQRSTVNSSGTERASVDWGNRSEGRPFAEFSVCQEGTIQTVLIAQAHLV